MNKKRYSDLIGSISAPESAVGKAVEGIYACDTQISVNRYKTKRRGYGRIAVIAAMLCMVLLVGVVFYPFGSKDKNGFILAVGAAEINNYELTKVGELKTAFNSLSLSFDESNKVTCITVCENLEFPIICKGENIEKVSYKMNGDGVFFLPDSSESFYDKVYLEDSSLLLPYTNTSFSYLEKAKSFTTDYPENCQGLLLCLYTSDNNGSYCKKYNEGYVVESDGIAHGKNMDYQQMFYELYSAAEYSVDITVCFEDGSTQTKTVELVVEKSDVPSQTENSTSLIVSAKLAE